MKLSYISIFRAPFKIHIYIPNAITK